MTIAFWCVLAALLAPYLLSVAARSQRARADYVEDPRAFSLRSHAWRLGILCVIGLFVISATHGRA